MGTEIVFTIGVLAGVWPQQPLQQRPTCGLVLAGLVACGLAHANMWTSPALGWLGGLCAGTCTAATAAGLLVAVSQGHTCSTHLAGGCIAAANSSRQQQAVSPSRQWARRPGRVMAA
jgi:hypothetical protein